MDRAMSVFRLRYRYRCGRLGCGWEGTLPPPQLPRRRPAMDGRG
jgi:hypothetical protein